MPTKFGTFISGKFFSKLFLVLFILFTCFSAYETGAALCLLVGKNLYGAAYVVFALIAISIMTKKTVSTKWNNRFYKKVVSFLSCFFIYYLLTLLLWELICFIIPISVKIKAIGVIVSAILGILIVVVGYLHTKNIRTKHYDIHLGSGNNTCNVALVSDIHIGDFVGAKHIAKAVHKINLLSPDIVVISGDIFDVDQSIMNDSAEIKRISKQFRKIEAKEGIYAVVGNHDPKIFDKDFIHFLKSSKINLLDDEWKELSEIILVGRTDKGNNIRKEYSEIHSPDNIEKPIVVLDHNPQDIDDAIENGAALVLCGHTHRGQMFPITLFTKWANGKKHFYGHEEYGQAHSIITSGVGFFELPVRIGTDNEIVDIHLQI